MHNFLKLRALVLRNLNKFHLNRQILKLNPVPLQLTIKNQFFSNGTIKYVQDNLNNNNNNSVEHSIEAKNHYEKNSNETLESLSERFDEISDELGDALSSDYDVSFSNGVLNIKLGEELGTYVLNKQTPNLQIWLSSPVSGPKRFDFVNKTWIYKRTGESLHELLEREFTECFGKKIDFSKCAFAPKK